MERFRNDKVTKNNSIPKIRQFCLCARKGTDQAFFLTSEIFFQFSVTFPGFPWLFAKTSLFFRFSLTAVNPGYTSGWMLIRHKVKKNLVLSNDS